MLSKTIQIDLESETEPKTFNTQSQLAMHFPKLIELVVFDLILDQIYHFQIQAQLSVNICLFNFISSYSKPERALISIDNHKIKNARLYLRCCPILPKGSL